MVFYVTIPQRVQKNPNHADKIDREITACVAGDMRGYRLLPYE